MDSVLCWILMVVASFGALCNVVSVFIFLKQRFRKAFHQLLMLLAVYDFLVSQLILRMPCIYVLKLWSIYRRNVEAALFILVLTSAWSAEKRLPTKCEIPVDCYGFVHRGRAAIVI